MDPLDPADPADSHVWLITRYGTFREFGNLTGGVYEVLAPSDEYRTLKRTSIGWTLTDLDGTVTEFDDAGRWLSTTARNPAVVTQGHYDPSGRLDEVDLPDQRKELFAYYEAPDPAEGKLKAITEVGVDGVSTYEWQYLWSGDDLERIVRPDQTALKYLYDATYAGYLTRVTLIDRDGSDERIERAWEYDGEGRVKQAWSGSADPETGVDRWQYSYDSETQTTVTDPLNHPATYTYDRDPASSTVRVREIEGDCPSCGLGPSAQMSYTDAANPLRPTSMIDGNGNETDYQYDVNGQVTQRTEAVGVPGQQRMTSYAYDPSHGAWVTQVTAPSVESGQDRITLYGRDSSGNVTDREIRGFEDGVAFDCSVASAPCYDTVTMYNAQGQPEEIDPPGYGTDDVTSFTYDPTRGSLLADSRTDPVIGTTSFAYDAFNRRTSVTDVNAVTTETEYDELGRVVTITQLGATPAEDLVTRHVYNAFSDLFRTTLPAGNVIEYSYDAAGRLTTIERKPDAATPGERAVYQLDDAGNRTREDLERWNGSAWVTDSSTSYLYSTRCQLDQVLNPDGSITEYDYDCNGNLEHTWDANHPSGGKMATPTATYGYDKLDRLTTVTRPWDGPGGGTSVTSFGYDVQNHLTAVTDAEASTTTYTYSDRDLLTAESSLVSGTTTHAYNAHGELVETVDARDVSELRSVDALNRVTFVDYPDHPDDSLDTTYTYDDPLVAFSLGRLTAIDRLGSTVEYAYDRFGRIIQDGELTYAHDENGSVTTIGYPGDVTASYGYDFADRQQTLTVTRPAGTLPAEVTAVVTAATYKPSGPLTSLTFGSGAVETRGFDSRYFPESIALDATADRSWTYTTDEIGSVTKIEETADCSGDVVLVGQDVTTAKLFTSCAGLTAGPGVTVKSGGDLTFHAATSVALADGFQVESGGRLAVAIDPDLSGNVTRTYGYQDVDYFLEAATGPWGSQSWTFDKIGNRLTETDNGATEVYHYEGNGMDLGGGVEGHTARLTSIDLATLGSRTYGYTAAGHVDSVTAGANVIDFDWDDAGRLEQSTSPNGTSAFRYDGRGFLRFAGDAATVGTVTPTYDSSGILRSLLREPAGDPTRRYSIFYLAGRPVAQLATESGQPDRWWYLTTDHLGTPLVATDASQGTLWTNRFEPFGNDPWAGTSLGALKNEMYLRFPGQWEDEVWQRAMLGADGYYNVYRWYRPTIGRYLRPDPDGLIWRQGWQTDPIVLPVVLPILSKYPVHVGLLNLSYAYSDQAPLTFTDLDAKGILSTIKCFLNVPVCITRSSDCRDAWQCKFRRLYARERYEAIKELLDEEEVDSTEQFVLRVCFKEISSCRKILKECPSLAQPGAPGLRPTSP